MNDNSRSKYIFVRDYSGFDLHKKVIKVVDKSGIEQSKKSSILSKSKDFKKADAFRNLSMQMPKNPSFGGEKYNRFFPEMDSISQTYKNTLTPIEKVGVFDGSRIKSASNNIPNLGDIYPEIPTISQTYKNKYNPVKWIESFDAPRINTIDINPSIGNVYKDTIEALRIEPNIGSANITRTWGKLSTMGPSFDNFKRVSAMTSLHESPKITESSRVNLTASSISSQISGLDKTTKISPLLNEMSQKVKFISDYSEKLNHNFFESPTTTQAFIGRLNKLPEDYNLGIFDSPDKQERDIYIKSSKNASEIPFDSTAPSLGALELITNLTEVEVMDFYNHLSEYPMLGLSHEVGKKILEWIKDAELTPVEKDSFHYRARVRPVNQQRPFTYPEMWEPPYGVSTHGRYNFIGENALYTSDKPNSASNEIKEKGIKDVVKLKLSKSVKVLNMAKGDYPLLRYCQFDSTSTSNVKPEYLVPNFIAQCCRHNNIAGLKFTNISFADTYNYAFFTFSKGWFESEKIMSDVN